MKGGAEMASVIRGQELHDRACRGLRLTEQERAELEAWYSEMDSAEDSLFRQNAEASESEIQRQIESGLSRLRQLRIRAEELEIGNRKLEAEVGQLRRR